MFKNWLLTVSKLQSFRCPCGLCWQHKHTWWGTGLEVTMPSKSGVVSDWPNGYAKTNSNKNRRASNCLPSKTSTENSKNTEWGVKMLRLTVSVFKAVVVIRKRENSLRNKICKNRQVGWNFEEQKSLHVTWNVKRNCVYWDVRCEYKLLRCRLKKKCSVLVMKKYTYYSCRICGLILQVTRIVFECTWRQQHLTPCRGSDVLCTGRANFCSSFQGKWDI